MNAFSIARMARSSEEYLAGCQVAFTASSTARFGSGSDILEEGILLDCISVLSREEPSRAHGKGVSLPEELVVESLIHVSASLSHCNSSVRVTSEHDCL